MPRAVEGPLTKDVLVDETRFLLKTLLRDDLFGEEVSLMEAEKLLDPSLALAFTDYTSFLKKREYITVDRGRNTVKVTAKGRSISEGYDDPDFHREFALHFGGRIQPTAAPAAPVATVAPMTFSRPTTATRGPVFGSAMPPANTPVLTERFVRGEHLGQGGLGSVFAGRDAVMNRPVAIKEYRHLFDYLTYLQRDDVLRRLKTAILAQAALEHPHISRIWDLQFEREPHVAILEMAAGGNLKRRLQLALDAKGMVPARVACRWFFQMAYALHFAHRHGVVHGDLKPENVLLDACGNVRVTDFGVARVVEKAPGQGSPVYVGVGNPSYMAPEQLHGTAELAPAADIYALGILMYQVATGKLPGRRSPMPSELNAQMPKALDALFDQMTQDRPQDRTASMDDVLEGLYAAFPRDDVLTRGNLLLFESDPVPPTTDEVTSDGDDHTPPEAPQV